MDSNIINELMYIFNFSNSSDELFDTFNYAIQNKVDSLELYQHLLWNPALSKDEIVLFICKIASVFPEFSYDLCLLAATIFEFYAIDCEDYLTALSYYQKAITIDPEPEIPYLGLINLYNKDLDLPPLSEVLRISLEGIETVKYKSKIYYALSDLYGKLDDELMKKKYRQFGDSAVLNEELIIKSYRQIKSYRPVYYCVV